MSSTELPITPIPACIANKLKLCKLFEWLKVFATCCREKKTFRPKVADTQHFYYDFMSKI